MKKLRVEDAVGHTICHDMTAILANGFKGVRFPRGHVITASDIPALLDIGKTHVYVWDPQADEVHEDDAARAIAEAIAGENIALAGPAEGKFQLTAQCDGLYCVHTQALRDINAVPDYTVVSRPNHSPVKTGEKLAGARIVPLVTLRANVQSAVSIARQSAPVLRVRPYRPLRVGLVITGSEVYHGRIADRFEPLLREKLAPYGAQVLGARKAPDDLHAIGQALDAFLAEGAQLVLLTGGMSVDPDDLTPTAIRQTGAHIVTQGVPMQPGNMLMIAYRDSVTLVGVPGGALHSRTTSLDVFLPRIFVGDTISSGEIARLGEGGFCMGCKECHYPICYFGFA